MKGLIKKDLLVIKSNIKHLLLLVLIFCFLSIDGNNMFYYIPTFISTMLFITTFSYDEINKWDSYAITLPKGRKNVVKAKYITSILIICWAILLTYIGGIIFGELSNSLNISLLNNNIYSCLFGALLIISLSFPLIFKYGVERGRIFLIVIIFGFIFLISLISKYITIPEYLKNIDNQYGMYIISIIILLILFISYLISKKIYQKKEF